MLVILLISVFFFALFLFFVLFTFVIFGVFIILPLINVINLFIIIRLFIFCFLMIIDIFFGLRFIILCFGKRYVLLICLLFDLFVLFLWNIIFYRTCLIRSLVDAWWRCFNIRRRLFWKTCIWIFIYIGLILFGLFFLNKFTLLDFNSFSCHSNLLDLFIYLFVINIPINIKKRRNLLRWRLRP